MLFHKTKFLVNHVFMYVYSSPNYLFAIFSTELLLLPYSLVRFVGYILSVSSCAAYTQKVRISACAAG